MVLNKLYKSFGYKAVQIVGFTLYSALLIPFLVRFWDIKTYGSWIAIYAMYNLIQVVEFGHNTYVGNSFNALVNSDVQKAKAVIGSAFRVNFIASFIQMSVVWIAYFIGAIRFFIQSDISDLDVAFVLSILFLYRMFIGSYRGLLIKMLNPFGFIYKSYQFALIERVLEFVILVSAAVSGISLIQTALLWLSVKSVFSLFVLNHIKNTLKDYFPWWQEGSFKEGLVNFKNSFAYIASNFLDRSVVDGLLLLVSVLMGTTFLPLFIATRTFVNFGAKIADVFLGPLSPELINLFASKNLDKLNRVITYYWFVTGAILSFGFLCTVWLVEPIFDIWISGRLDFKPILYYGLVVVLIVQNYGAILYQFLMGINKTTLVLKTALLRYLLLFGSLYLFYPMGIKGIVLALFVAEFTRSLIWLPYWYTKHVEVPITARKGYWINLLNVGAAILFFYLFFRSYNSLLLVGLLVVIAFIFYLQFKLIPKIAVQRVQASLRALRKKISGNGSS